MGFEQLAALKAQLAEQAKAEKATKAAKAGKPTQKAKPPRARNAAPAKPAKAEKPVDPVVFAIGKLQKRFPQTFPKNPAPKVPLKIGLFEDVMQHAQELALTEAELRAAIRTWCHGTRYWNALVESAPRIDLTGQETGQVTEADAKRAKHLQASRAARARAKPAEPPKAEPPKAEPPKAEPPKAD